MDNIGWIIAGCIGGFAAIGLIIGLVKGFTNVKSWANDYIISTVVAIALGIVVEKNLGGKSGGFQAALPAVIVIAIAVAMLIIMTFLSWRWRKLIAKGIEKHKKLVMYRQQEEVQDNNEQILDALYTENKAEYRKLTSKKFRQGAGGWGVVNRVFGGITLAVKAAVMLSIVVLFVLFLFDVTSLTSVTGKLGGIYDGKVWAFTSKYLFDFLIVGILFICIRCGYSSGISSGIWALVVIGLIGGAGLLSYHIVFKTSLFTSAAQSFDENCVSGWFGDSSEMLAKMNITTYTVAQSIITAGVFLVFLIVVILIAVFVPRFIDSAREGATFRVIDGVLGAIVATAVVAGIFMFLFGMLQTASELDFMQNFNAYFTKSGVARYFYSDNILVKLGYMPVNLAKWLG